MLIEVRLENGLPVTLNTELLAFVECGENDNLHRLTIHLKNDGHPIRLFYKSKKKRDEVYKHITQPALVAGKIALLTVLRSALQLEILKDEELKLLKDLLGLVEDDG